MNAKSHIIKIFFLTLAIVTHSVFAGTIDGQATGPNLHTYVVVSLPGVVWDQADGDVGSTLGSDYHLATVTSQEEQDFIAGLLDDSGAFGQFWLGGEQNPAGTTSPAANWTWVTGEAWAYTNWSAGEPNDFNGPASEQQLGMVSDRGWAWNDQSNNWFIYGYVAESSTATIQIDIKPDSDPNCINLGSKGVVPVAILGSADFDVSNVDQSTVVFEGAPPQAKGKSGKLGNFEDVNNDGFDDLVMHFPTQDLSLTESDTEGELTGKLYGYTFIVGTDAVCIVPPALEKGSFDSMTPTDYQLAPNVPNPFNPSTRITYAIPEQASVTLDVYNIRGERVASLVNAVQPQGVHSILWNGTTDSGQLVPGGLYIARLNAGSYTQTIRMILMK